MNQNGKKHNSIKTIVLLSLIVAVPVLSLIVLLATGAPAVTTIIITTLAAALAAYTIKQQRMIRNNKMFVEMTRSANIPIFVISRDRKLYWTNIETIGFANATTPGELVEELTNSEAASEAIAKCLEQNTAQTYESVIKINDHTKWLHVTLSKVKHKSDTETIYGTISDISNLKEASEKIENQQRELQMQNDMLSLITAQMEVQQAGIKEQNEVLSQQHKTLEEQAKKLTDAFQELEFRNRQLTIKTNYITDSIKYAQTIQEAMLPGKEQLEAFFDNFIVYRPKDIVSGDFYWLSITPEYTFAAIGDCTGHGVPGAFMSMIGIRLLGELINENKIYCTSEILETMHEKIHAALKQNVSENNDGMDIAICRFKRVQGEQWQWEMQYAGAKQPIFIYKKSTREVVTVEADRRGIGGQSYAEIFFFNDQIIHLDNGDRIFLTTDGIKDQNNIMRKRFGTTRVKNMIAMTYTEKIQDQKMFVDTLLNNWEGLEEQRDDISLWGFELNDKAQPAAL